jgi:thiosulfate dehydrogenase (quinone) large subunit
MTATIERTTTATTIAPAAETPRERAARFVWAGTRIALGWIFLWAFLDKAFGLGHETESKNAWINGGSPTKGFLTFGAAGPFKGIYHDIAGATWADWLFMIGLAGIGVALLLGIGMRIAAVSGALLYLLMWTVALPPENNPILDDHIIGALVLIALALVHAGDTFGLGRWWKNQPFVRRNPWLI